MSCPSNPPPPAGWRVWRKPVPQALTQWAMDLRDHINAFPYGQTWTTTWGGEAVLARKDRHTWTNRRQPDGSMKLVSGICIPGITLYETVPAGYTGIENFDTPDPTAAVYGADDVPPAKTSWGLVALTAGATLSVVGLVWLGVKLAGAPRLT